MLWMSHVKYIYRRKASFGAAVFWAVVPSPEASQMALAQGRAGSGKVGQRSQSGQSGFGCWKREMRG
jgi:hypothetical protein